MSDFSQLIASLCAIDLICAADVLCDSYSIMRVFVVEGADESMYLIQC